MAHADSQQAANNVQQGGNKDFPPWFVAGGKVYVALGLIPVELSIDDKCGTCMLYRQKLGHSLLKFKLRSALKYAYFGAVRWSGLDRRDQWDAVDVKPQDAKLLRNVMGRAHRMMLRLSGSAPAAWSRRARRNRIRQGGLRSEWLQTA